MSPNALIMPARMAGDIVAHLRRELPNEGCGLLATVDAPGRAWRTVRFYPGDNIDRSPRRYTMDPRQVMRAIDDIEQRGWRLGGIVHSHPRTAAEPSETDLREAYYAGVVLVIVSFKDDRPESRAWLVAEREREATEIPLRVAREPVPGLLTRRGFPVC